MTAIDKEIDDKLKEGTEVEEQFIRVKNARIEQFNNTFNIIKDNIDHLYKKLTRTEK